jgi:hypothetical protein
LAQSESVLWDDEGDGVAVGSVQVQLARCENEITGWPTHRRGERGTADPRLDPAMILDQRMKPDDRLEPLTKVLISL